MDDRVDRPASDQEIENVIRRWNLRRPTLRQERMHKAVRTGHMRSTSLGRTSIFVRVPRTISRKRSSMLSMRKDVSRSSRVSDKWAQGEKGSPHKKMGWESFLIANGVGNHLAARDRPVILNVADGAPKPQRTRSTTCHLAWPNLM